MSEDFLSLSVVQEPPEEWYNQQGGKHRTIDVIVKLEGDIPREVVKKEGIIPLAVELLYENRQMVKDQSILELKEAPELDVNTKLATLKLRVTQVSSVHQKQRFRFKVSVQHSNPVLKNTRPTYTGAVRVLSKTTKNKRRKVEPPSPTGDAADRSNVPASQPLGGNDLPQEQVSSLLDWCRDAISLCHQVSWQVVGYECVQHSLDSNSTVDTSLPIYRCPLCAASGTTSAPGSHAISCPFKGLQRRYMMLLSNYVDGSASGGTGGSGSATSLPLSGSGLSSLQSLISRPPGSQDPMFPSFLRSNGSLGSGAGPSPLFFPTSDAMPVGPPLSSGRQNSLSLARSDSLFPRKRGAGEIAGSQGSMEDLPDTVFESGGNSELSLSQTDPENSGRKLLRDSSVGFISHMLQTDLFQADSQEFDWIRHVPDVPEEGGGRAQEEVGVLWKLPFPDEASLQRRLVFKLAVPVLSPKVGLLGFIHSAETARTGRVAPSSVLLALEPLGLASSHADIVSRLSSVFPELKQQLPAAAAASGDASPEEKEVEHDLATSGLVFTPLSECWDDGSGDRSFPPSEVRSRWNTVIMSTLKEEAAGIQRSFSFGVDGSWGEQRSGKGRGNIVLVVPTAHLGPRAQELADESRSTNSDGSPYWSKRDSDDAVQALDKLRRG